MDHKGSTSYKRSLLLFCLLLIVFGGFVLQFVRSLECPLDPQLVAKVNVDSKCVSRENIYTQWHAVYEEYDQVYGTWIHSHECYESFAIDPWPELDLENYTYIITYCQEIESLSYYRWREINVPVPPGAKEGHLVLKEEFEPFAIYFYRIPKMRINNPEI